MNSYQSWHGKMRGKLLAALEGFDQVQSLHVTTVSDCDHLDHRNTDISTYSRRTTDNLHCSPWSPNLALTVSQDLTRVISLPNATSKQLFSELRTSHHVESGQHGVEATSTCDPASNNRFGQSSSNLINLISSRKVPKRSLIDLLRDQCDRTQIVESGSINSSIMLNDSFDRKPLIQIQASSAGFTMDSSEPHKKCKKIPFDHSEDHTPQEIIPFFDSNSSNDENPLLLDGNETHARAFVHSHARRCLLNHQVSGVSWLWQKYISSQGCILGDDMGMGKTIQIINLFLAVYGKTGIRSTDNMNLRTRKSSFPSLVIAPTTVISNWEKEIKIWGIFGIVMIKTYLDEDLVDIINQPKTEIVLVTYSLIKRYIHILRTISWNIIVFDEGHCLKNHKTQLFQDIMKLNSATSRMILTGTPVQNRLQELWCLLFVVTNRKFFHQRDFIQHFVEPIKRSMSRLASEESIQLGRKRQKELGKILNRFYLSRKKEDLTGENSLQGKDEIIVLCELSQLQRMIYEHVLTSPDFQNVKLHSQMCPCGSHKMRSLCCKQFIKPYTVDSNGRLVKDSYQQPIICPQAVMWRQMHKNDDSCEKCPTCCVLPCITKLVNISSHLSLLQTASCSMETQSVNFYHNALSEDIKKQFPLVKELNFLDIIKRSPEYSGKLATMLKLLEIFVFRGEKTLIFTYSVRLLDIIEDIVKGMGWEHKRLDGSTPKCQRQLLVDGFNESHTCQIFMASSKAGGLGINLKSASKVIIFDMHWNPTVDQQSQDRAYRIGQKNRVSVYRLVSKGTIEELIYMRQLYKQQMQNIALNRGHGCSDSNYDVVDDDFRLELSAQSDRSKLEKTKSVDTAFVGIMDDKSCYGELFGCYNLLQFSNSSILQQLRQQYESENDIEPTDDHIFNCDIQSINRIDMEMCVNAIAERDYPLRAVKDTISSRSESRITQPGKHSASFEVRSNLVHQENEFVHSNGLVCKKRIIPAVIMKSEKKSFSLNKPSYLE